MQHESPEHHEDRQNGKHINAVFNAALSRSLSGYPVVNVKNIGMPPSGFTIGNSARNVAPAADGRVFRNRRNRLLSAHVGITMLSAKRNFGKCPQRNNQQDVVGVNPVRVTLDAVIGWLRRL